MARFRKQFPLGSVLIAMAVVPALAGCYESATVEPSPVPSGFQVSPAIDRVVVNDSVGFSLVDAETGEVAIDAVWGITSPHNVPGDRGVMRSDGVYTAPRFPTTPQTVKFNARFQKVDYPYEVYIIGPGRLYPNAPARPGDSHLFPGPPLIETTRPIEGGLPAGESAGFTFTDGGGRPVIVDHFEILPDHRGTDYTGTMTADGVFTAPLLVPEPPSNRISVYYLTEGGEPGSKSLLRTSVLIVP